MHRDYCNIKDQTPFKSNILFCKNGLDKARALYPQFGLRTKL
jgi:hypothetical protein